MSCEEQQRTLPENLCFFWSTLLYSLVVSSTKFQIPVKLSVTDILLVSCSYSVHRVTGFVLDIRSLIPGSARDFYLEHFVWTVFIVSNIIQYIMSIQNGIR
jgi:hypothetical protein